VEYYKGDEHPSREAFFQGGRDEADCDDEEGGFGPTNEGGSSSKGQRVLIQKWVISSRRQFLEGYLMPIAKSFFLHQWVNHRQALCYQDIKRLLLFLPEGHVMFISDFAMNASPLLENKEAFFAKGQVSLKNLVIYRVVNGKLIMEGVVYLSDDRNHSVKFVHHCLEHQILRLKEILRSEGKILTHIHLHTDGCAGQYKNSKMFAWLCEMLGKHVAILYHFFCSNHGKGPCDTLGAIVKNRLRSEEKLRGAVWANAEEARALLENHFNGVSSSSSEGVPADGEAGRVYKRLDFVVVPRGAVDNATYNQVPTIKGSKSKHFFMARPGSELVVSKVSCTCMRCLQGDVGNCSRAVRAMLGPYETCTVRVIRTGTASQEHRKKLWKRAVEICNSVASKEEEHPYIFIYTPIPNRQGAVSLERGSDGVEPLGDSVGSFMLAQLVKRMPAVRMPSTLSRSAIKIRVAYAKEVEPEKIFSFERSGFCLDEKGACRHTSSCACELKHYDEVTVKALRGKVFTMAEYLQASGQARALSSATARAIERSRSNSRGCSSSSTAAVGERFILPESWREELLAQIKDDEDTIPHDLLLWES
jgi:hypothetical protein